ncbi:MAG TPA: M23 family metallopeptidase [Acidimicrobiales bacterium]
MRRELLAPALLAGGLVVVLSTSGLALTDGGGGGTRLEALDAAPIVAGRDVPAAGDRSTVPAGPPTTPKPAPTTTTSTTTTTLPPTTTTTAPPPTTAAPAPEPVVSSGGGIVCPVSGASFVDSWGAARSGGRAHQGVDMMAPHGTPTVAPVSGTVEHRGSSVGGLSWYVHGDDGNTYFGTHLSAYENQGAGRVAAGTVIGYVGDSGNAAGTPHLHFEYHPGGGSPTNPYPLVSAAC